MSAGRQPARATFWLLEAPDSLSAQSHHEPDGTGLGIYHDGRPLVYKQPLPAYADREFARQAREVTSRTFVAHVRYASNGGLVEENTHPFEQAERLFAHNGVIGDLPGLEQELGDDMRLVAGETDSERFFALITREIERSGDIREGIISAAGWVAGNLPVLSLNFVLITADELWALRYPDQHELHVLERAAGGHTGARSLDHRSALGRIRVGSEHMARHPAVVVATEPMDDDPGWLELGSGELLRVGPDLETEVSRVLTQPPAHPLTLADLDPRAAESQREPGE